MTINLEQIDILRERANVSYQEAKEALEKCSGDIVEALAYLEKTDKLKSDCNRGGDEYRHQHQHHQECRHEHGKFFSKIREIIIKGNKIKLIISKNAKTLLNIPVTAAVIVTVILLPVFAFVIAGVILLLVTGHKFKFEKANGEGMSVNTLLDNVSNIVTDTTNKFTDKMNKQDK